MTAYASQSDFEDYVEGWVTEDADALDRLLERASRDLDGLFQSRVVLASGFRWDLAAIDEPEKSAIVRATCAQAEYRNLMGEEFFSAPQYKRVSGPDFTTEGKTPYIAPKAKRELRLVQNLMPSMARGGL